MSDKKLKKRYLELVEDGNTPEDIIKILKHEGFKLD